MDQLYPKRVFLLENRKNEHHHRILHIRISLRTKFQLKLTILIFWAKLAQKGCFRSKSENSYLCECPWSLLTILNFLARGPTDNGICNKTRQKHLLIKVKVPRPFGMRHLLCACVFVPFDSTVFCLRKLKSRRLIFLIDCRSNLATNIVS